jgi:hypothetical protein
VFAKAVGPAIDLFTQSYRSYPPHYTPYNGTGPEEETDVFQPQDLIILYAKVTYNDDPVQNKLVAFEIRDSWQRKVLVRTAPTNASGIATIDFRIPWPCINPENEIFEQWQAYADVDSRKESVRLHDMTSRLDNKHIKLQDTIQQCVIPAMRHLQERRTRILQLHLHKHSQNLCKSLLRNNSLRR